MARKVKQPELRKGRYVRSLSPEEFKAKNSGTRPNVSLMILHGDYKLLWTLGRGRLSYGLQIALSELRRLQEEHEDE